MIKTKLYKYCENIIEATWIAGVILVPLFFNIYSSRIFEPDKVSILRSLALVCLAAWLIKGVLAFNFPNFKSIIKRQIKKLFKKPFLFPVILMVLVYILATLFSINPSVSWLGSYQRSQGTYTFLSYLVFFISIVTTMKTRDQLDRLINAIIIASIPVAIYGILQRFNLDPIPWGKDTSVRVSSNLGNSIFVAAYLIMVYPLVMGRFFQAIKNLSQHHRYTQYLRIAIYGLILVALLATIYFSGSRGPVLGWLAGIYFLLFLMTNQIKLPKLSILLVIISVAGGAFLVLFNIPSGPFVELRNSPLVGRFGRLLDTESNTAKVRTYIWKGAVELVTPHDPIVYPDGSEDSLNILRPFIGYGPESMFVVYNQFYPVELGRVEQRNASPDRSHNETWDSLIITGVFGFITYIGVFLFVFYYGLQWLGIMNGKPDKRLFWLFTLIGGILVVSGLVAWGGMEFFGVGLPFGFALGMVIYLSVWGIRTFLSKHFSAEIQTLDWEGKMFLTIILSAILAHFLEINFGIGIVSTRLLFWMYVGILYAVRFNIKEFNGSLIGEKLQSSVEHNEIDLSNEESPVRRKSLRRSRLKDKSQKVYWWEWLSNPNAGIHAVIIAFVIVTLAYDFIINPERITSTSELLNSSLFHLSSKGGQFSLGIFLMILVTWLTGIFILHLEDSSTFKEDLFFRKIFLTMGASLGIILPYIFIHTRLLISIASKRIVNMSELLAQSENVIFILGFYYLFIGLIIFLTTYFLIGGNPVKIPELKMDFPGVLLSILIVLAVLFSINTTNLQPIQADILFKLAEPFSAASQWDIVSVIYDRAIKKNPREDYYYLFRGKVFLELAKMAQSPADQSSQVLRSEESLLQAQRLNPLNPDHSANLARLFSWWASESQSMSGKASYVEKASSYYEKAVLLKPNNPLLWGEWSTLYIDVVEQLDRSKLLLDRALELDSEYDLIQNLAGNYYLKLALTISNQVERDAAYAEAISHYQKAVNLSKNESQIKNLVDLSKAYISQAEIDGSETGVPVYDPNKLELALNTLIQADMSKEANYESISIKAQIAKIYNELNDKENALRYINMAIVEASENQKPFLEQIKTEILSNP